MDIMKAIYKMSDYFQELCDHKGSDMTQEEYDEMDAVETAIYCYIKNKEGLW